MTDWLHPGLHGERALVAQSELWGQDDLWTTACVRACGAASADAPPFVE